MEKVSFIIPCYRSEKTLPAVIDEITDSLYKFLLENTGETKKVNDYAKMFEPAKLDRKNMQ